MGQGSQHPQKLEAAGAILPYSLKGRMLPVPGCGLQDSRPRGSKTCVAAVMPRLCSLVTAPGSQCTLISGGRGLGEHGVSRGGPGAEHALETYGPGTAVWPMKSHVARQAALEGDMS